MIFGVLKDIKEGENRVICTPIEVASIVAAGHTVLVQKDAGARPSTAAPEQMLMRLLADREMHRLDELDSLPLSRAAMSALLRHLCDEEKIIIKDGKITIR